MKPTAYSYIRFSTTKQREGDSERRQLALSAAYADKHGLVLDTTLNLRDLGVSAFKGANLSTGNLGRFLDAVNNGIVRSGSYLLIESLDRLSRAEIDEAFTVFRSILKLGVSIVTLQDEQVFTKESLNDFAKIIVSLVVMSRAHEESMTKSMRGKADWENKRKLMRSGKVVKANHPVWLTRDGDRFVAKKEMAESIRKIFELYSKQLGVIRISKYMTAHGYAVVSKKLKVWRCDIIQRLLRNRTVIGEYQPFHVVSGKRAVTGEPVQDYYPAIVSKKVFLAAQGRLAAVKPKVGRHSEGITNLFTGKLFCPYCGSSVNVYYAYPKRGETKYKPIRHLKCTNALNGHCINVSWRLEEFEENFLQLATEVKEAMFASANTKPLEAEIFACDGEIRSEKTKLERLMASIEEAVSVPKVIVERIAVTETRIEQLEANKRKLEAKLASLIHSNNAKDVDLVDKRDWTTDERERLSGVIQNTVKRVRLFFAGPHETRKELELELNKLKKSGVAAHVATKAVRALYDIKSVRFFVVDLMKPGKNARLVYPHHDSNRYGLYLREDDKARKRAA
ncbi:MAG: recombinase family protein [Opitutaceae bacterium]